MLLLIRDSLNKKQTELRKSGQTHIKKRLKNDDALAKHFIDVLNGHFFFGGEEHPDDVKYGVERVTLMEDYKYIVKPADYEAVEMVREKYKGTEITEIASKQIFVTEYPDRDTAIMELGFGGEDIEPQQGDYYLDAYNRPVLRDDARERINGFSKLVERYRMKGQRGKRGILLYVTVVCYGDIISIEQRI